MSLTLSSSELAVAQAAHRVVLVQALLRLGGALDVPLQQRHAQRFGHFLGQHGLAGAGFALDEQRAFEGDGGVDGQHQVGRGDVAGRSLGTSSVQYRRAGPYNPPLFRLAPPHTT
jgi:hypothetical protein